jgi:tRNA pseudouridine38-40 synthase
MHEQTIVKLTLQYDGTGFHGFQKQKHGAVRTVQQDLECALGGLAARPVEVQGAGRTDAGVHALGQVVSFAWSGALPPERVAPALGPLLPPDMAALESEAAPHDFHAQFSAVAKTYAYLCYPARRPAPLLRHRALHVPAAFDPALAEAALEPLVGTHDFSAFENAGSTPRDPVKTIHAFTLERRPPFFIFLVTGSGFLYRQVRNMVGAAVDAGLGRMGPQDITRALESRDRALAGPCLPAHGLYMVRVFYEPSLVSHECIF